MHDPFEKSLREMLNAESAEHDDQACLGKVLKTANRQVGAGDLLGLVGNWASAFMMAINNGSAHLKPVRRSTNNHSDKA